MTSEIHIQTTTTDNTLPPPSTTDNEGNFTYKRISYPKPVVLPPRPRAEAYIKIDPKIFERIENIEKKIDKLEEYIVKIYEMLLEKEEGITQLTELFEEK